MRLPIYYYNLSEDEQIEWIKAKKEKMRSYVRKWKAKNPEKLKIQKAKWCAKSPEKCKMRIAKWRAGNPQKVKNGMAKYHAKRREKRAAIKFFQMTQAISEIANINTEKK